MTLTNETIRQLFPAHDYQRGLVYYRNDRVEDYDEFDTWQGLQMTAQIRGTHLYHTSATVQEQGVLLHCSCPRYQETGTCKHLAALLLYGINHKQSSPAALLLDRYLEHTDPGNGLVHLVPRLECTPGMKTYPEISFFIGAKKLYTVKNISNFLDYLDHGSTFTYGKQLTLRHCINNFDPRSQEIIGLLRNYRDMCYYAQSPWSHSLGSKVTFMGDTFDHFFQLYLDQTLELTYTKEAILLTDGDPECSMCIEQVDNSVRLDLGVLSRLGFFGNGITMYTYCDGFLYRCSKEFLDKMTPLLHLSSKELWFTRQELPTFCSCVLPAIGSFVQLEDPMGIVQQYAPDPCTPCFYFDFTGERLTARLTYRYGDLELTEDHEGVKRNLAAERDARQHLLRWFQPVEDDKTRFYLTGDDEIFDFLTETLPDLHNQGEVYVSDRLQSRQFRPSSASVGVSVSDGLLQLDIDTGGFPASELEDLYRSMLQRRKYHKLEDGRFLALDGSACESMAEAAHMLQLSPDDLEKGTISLPAYRGLYLDNLLRKKEGIVFNRDEEFQAMVRRFQAVEDSDFAPPESLAPILRSYQATGFRWLKTLESCGFGGILADEMGLGKTLQLITFLSTVPKAVTGKPNLIACPASLVLNWADEFARFAPSYRVALILGSAQERERKMAQSVDADVWITSYDLLKRDQERYEAYEFYCFSLDEGQYVKNQTTKISKTVKSIHCRQRFVLTGTPIENRLSELWNLFDFLMPGYLFTHNRFVEKLEKPIVQSESAEAKEQLSRLVRPFLLRRLKSEVLQELPPKLEYDRRIPLSDGEMKLYHAAASAAKGTFAGGEKMAILAALTRLRQICCDPDLCFENYTGESSKLQACLELCSGMAENGHQILLFSQFTSMLDRIRSRLDEAGITSFTIQGSTPKEKRAELVKRFNAGGAQVFLISLKAGGTGLNLTSADVVIHYDPWWNLAAQNQATDRAHRIGQRSCVQVYKLIAKDTIEEKIQQLQSRKAHLMDAIAGNNDMGLSSMSSEELLELLDLPGLS